MMTFGTNGENKYMSEVSEGLNVTGPETSEGTGEKAQNPPKGPMTLLEKASQKPASEIVKKAGMLAMQGPAETEKSPSSTS